MASKELKAMEDEDRRLRLEIDRFSVRRYCEQAKASTTKHGAEGKIRPGVPWKGWGGELSIAPASSQSPWSPQSWPS